MRFVAVLSIALIAAALSGASGVGSRSATAQAGSMMTIDADPSTLVVDAVSPPVAVGSEVTVSVSITAADEPYTTYQWLISFNPANVDYVTGSGTHLSPAGLSACATFGEGTFAESPLAGQEHVGTFCGVADFGTRTTFTGQVDVLRFRCVSAGTHALHLVTTSEDAVSGTTVVGETTDTSDATIVCQDGGGPAPTPTATPVGDATPVPTPVGPVATPTPLPPGFEAVPLVGGCQFEAWTGADGTSPGELAGLVGPAGALRSLWAQQPAPSWRGYSPQFPDVSDMGPVNLLDVVAICTTGPGNFVRPLV